MDLSELRPGMSHRHPWERARVRAVRALLAPYASQIHSILDVGCGDGFVGEAVQDALDAHELVGIDMHLPESQCAASRPSPGRVIERYQSDAGLGDRRFDLVLALDVIEHVAHDVTFVRELIARRARPGARALVIVPAFQSLFSDHGRALRHYRRYRASELRRVLMAAGLRVDDAGYILASLLAPRVLAKIAEGLGWRREEHGAGGWEGSPLLTRVLSAALTLDARTLLAAQRLGLTLPGLTAWALCTAP